MVFGAWEADRSGWIFLYPPTVPYTTKDQSPPIVTTDVSAGGGLPGTTNRTRREQEKQELPIQRVSAQLIQHSKAVGRAG